MGRLLRFAYDCTYLLAFPWLAWRIVASSGRASLLRRFCRRPGPVLQNAIWLHGSSAGEMAALRPLIAVLERDHPESPLIISTTSKTGFEATTAAYPGHHVVECPFDFRFVVRRFLRNVDLRLAVFAESELWPNCLTVLQERGVSIAIVNGKMSEKSFEFHQRTRFVPSVLRNVDIVAVQAVEHAERMKRLGVGDDRLKVTGNMKHDLADIAVDFSEARRERERLGYAHSSIVLIGGSLHDREHGAILDAYSQARQQQPHLRLIMAPRYPADAPSVSNEIRARGFAVALATQLQQPANRLDAAGTDAVLVVDTIGQLGRLYAVADIAFVGGSLYYRGSNKGGHNVMEPAVCGVPILVGPYNFSFREPVQQLKAATAAIEVNDTDSLARAISTLAADPRKRARMGTSAREVILRAQGATARNYALIKPLLNPPH